MGAFSFVREHLANTDHNPRHPMNTGKSCEHAFGVRKIPYHHLLRIIIDLQSHSFQLHQSFLKSNPILVFANGVRKANYSVIPVSFVGTKTVEIPNSVKEDGCHLGHYVQWFFFTIG